MRNPSSLKGSPKETFWTYTKISIIFLAQSNYTTWWLDFLCWLVRVFCIPVFFPSNTKPHTYKIRGFVSPLTSFRLMTSPGQICDEKLIFPSLSSRILVMLIWPILFPARYNHVVHKETSTGSRDIALVFWRVLVEQTPWENLSNVPFRPFGFGNGLGAGHE